MSLGVIDGWSLAQVWFLAFVHVLIERLGPVKVAFCLLKQAKSLLVPLDGVFSPSGDPGPIFSVCRCAFEVESGLFSDSAPGLYLMLLGFALLAASGALPRRRL